MFEKYLVRSRSRHTSGSGGQRARKPRPARGRRGEERGPALQSPESRLRRTRRRPLSGGTRGAGGEPGHRPSAAASRPRAPPGPNRSSPGSSPLTPAAGFGTLPGPWATPASLCRRRCRCHWRAGSRPPGPPGPPCGSGQGLRSAAQRSLPEATPPPRAAGTAPPPEQLLAAAAFRSPAPRRNWLFDPLERDLEGGSFKGTAPVFFPCPAAPPVAVGSWVGSQLYLPNCGPELKAALPLLLSRCPSALTSSQRATFSGSSILLLPLHRSCFPVTADLCPQLHASQIPLPSQGRDGTARWPGTPQATRDSPSLKLRVRT